MLQVNLVGALGADAEKRTANGHEFVSFNVASSERFTKADGSTAEETTWVSCTLNGDGGKLLQYLRRGTTIYVSGRARTRVYSSPKERRMVAGLNLMVDSIELVGGRPDAVPGRLVTPDGALVDIRKAFFVEPTQWEGLRPEVGKLAYLYGERGGTYLMNNDGYVIPSSENDAAQVEEQQPEPPADAPFVGDGNSPAEDTKKVSRKTKKS